MGINIIDTVVCMDFVSIFFNIWGVERNMSAEAQSGSNQLPTPELGFMLGSWVERNRSTTEVNATFIQLQPPKLGLRLVIGGERSKVLALELGLVRLKMIHRTSILII